MKYLDRDPKIGDRVEVTYVGEYRMIGRPGSNEHILWAATSTGTQSACIVPDTATIRVIAPEPKVGDVLTGDMDLPVGTIVERSSDRSGKNEFTAKKVGVTDWSTGHRRCNMTTLVFLTDADAPWRIVRIGGGAQ